MQNPPPLNPKSYMGKQGTHGQIPREWEIMTPVTAPPKAEYYQNRKGGKPSCALVPLNKGKGWKNEDPIQGNLGPKVPMGMDSPGTTNSGAPTGGGPTTGPPDLPSGVWSDAPYGGDFLGPTTANRAQSGGETASQQCATDRLWMGTTKEIATPPVKARLTRLASTRSRNMECG